MADWPIIQETGTRENRQQESDRFKQTPEFAHFKAVMKRVLAVPKAEIDRKVRAAKKRSPRAGNPNSPGRKPRDKKDKSA
jgi:hypothetical protein